MLTANASAIRVEGRPFELAGANRKTRNTERK
jgi:hypothetical protein